MIEPDWPAPPGVVAVVTERSGGASAGAYAGLNLGDHVGDRHEHVAANRASLIEQLALPAEPCWLEQVHGTRVVDLDHEPPGVADAAVTSIAGRVCVALTADCLPVLFASTDGRCVGVAHAGWRGLLAGVLAATVARMPVPPDRQVAWLGPAIGQAAYEVGAEVRDAFVAAHADSADHFRAGRPGHWHADLYGLARASLARAGVEAVFGGRYCTFSERERFFSHRREAPCGRMATLIWRAP